VCGASWLPNLFRKGEGQARSASSLWAHWSHRSRDDGTESSSGRINWGPCASLEPRAISIKLAVARRSSDVAIVSQEAGGHYNRWRSQGPLDRRAVSEAASAAGAQARLRNKTRAEEIAAVAAYKLQQRRLPLTACLEPYWGKPAVRNLRGGGGNERNGLAAICHAA